MGVAGALAAGAGALSLTGGGLGAAGAAKSAGAARRAARYNARLEEYNAGQEINRLETVSRRLRAENITNIAASGIRLEGSALDVLASNAYDVSQQQIAIARAARANARLLRMSGSASKTAGRYGAAAQVLSGFGGAFNSLNPNGFFTS